MASQVMPIVRRRLKDGRVIVRAGRGFSLNELRRAGIMIEVAKRLGLPIDARRRSAHEENVRALKELLQETSKGYVSPALPKPPQS
ncbi:MAG: ribosomal protein L13e [Nitrososphaeria archaeon]|nr:ribosomal protein L13e [Nitrososphaeria archaeon]